MLTKKILYFGSERTVACDGNCNKAWCLTHRPIVQLSSEDEDDYYFLSDNELDIAPNNPGTYEGGDCKPYKSNEFPNRWCVRQCEWSDMFDIDEDIKLHDFSVRLYNKPFKH